MHAALVVCVVDGFFDNDSELTDLFDWLMSVSPVRGISFSMLAAWLVWCCFSTESLILAQDERWRRA